MGFVPDPEPVGRFVPDAAPPPLSIQEPPTPMAPIEGAYDTNVSGEWDKTHAGSLYGVRAMGAAASNIVPSAGRMVRGAVGLLTPSGIEGVSRVARGGLGINKEEAPAWEQFKEGVKERYGGFSNIENTFATDPTGLAAEFYGAGKLMQAGGRAAVRAAGINTAKRFDDASLWFMKKAVKPLPSYEPEVVDTAMKTALREGGDVAKLGKNTGAAIEDINNQMTRAADGYAAVLESRGQMVSMRPALERLRAYRNYVKRASRTPESDLAKIDSYIAEVEALPERITPTLALEQRRLLNSKLAPIFKKYKTIGGDAHETLIKELMVKDRSGLQDGLFEVMPELKDLGIKQSELIEYGKMVARRMNWTERSDIMGLPEWIAAAGTGSPSTAVVARLVRLPQFLSRVAYGLAKKGTLATVGDGTLELLGLTREGAINLQPLLRKALPPSPRAMPGSTPESYVKGVPSDVHFNLDYYDKYWKGIEDVIPSQPKKGYLGIPYEELEQGLVRKGKFLK